MNNIIKNQSTPVQTWGHRQTIQSQKQRIEELEKELDLKILQLTITREDLRRTNEQLNHKNGCFRIANEEIKELDKKLQAEKFVSSAAEMLMLDAQDEFFNLGDACMNRIAGLESPFIYE